MGRLKIGALPPERSGNDIGFAIGIDVANGSTFGQILIRQLDLLKKEGSQFGKYNSILCSFLMFLLLTN